MQMMNNIFSLINWDNVKPFVNNAIVIKNKIFEKISKRKSQRILKLMDMNIDNPRTIQEKINWLKIYDLQPLKSLCADKILIHEYCKDKLNKDICIPILKVYNKPEDINYNELPEKFVLKCNHGYKMNLIVTDKSTIDKSEFINKLNTWLNTKFGEDGGQYHYCGIKPKCFAETYMTNGSVGLTDYKVWCINGKPEFIMVINDRYNDKELQHSNAYDMNWEFFDLKWSTFKSDKTRLDDKPVNFELMKEYAAKLAEPFKLVRVDFYEINGVLYLGEMTFTPDNGIFRWDSKYEEKYGELLII